MNNSNGSCTKSLRGHSSPSLANNHTQRNNVKELSKTNADLANSLESESDNEDEDDDDDSEIQFKNPAVPCEEVFSDSGEEEEESASSQDCNSSQEGCDFDNSEAAAPNWNCEDNNTNSSCSTDSCSGAALFKSDAASSSSQGMAASLRSRSSLPVADKAVVSCVVVRCQATLAASHSFKR